MIQDVQSQPYRQNDPGKAILRPIERIGGQMRDFGLDNKYRCPKYIIGYTGMYIVWIKIIGMVNYKSIF